MKKNYLIVPKIFDFKTILVLVFLLFSANEIFSQVTVTFASSTTWTCPPNVTSIQVTAYGGGGGGGRGGTGNRNGGGGGGGGAYTENLTVPVTPGITYTITIGAAGAAGTTDGGSGGQTTATFDSATIISANGGIGGLAYANGATGGAGGAGGTRTGGVGGTGNANGSGGGGGGAGTISNGGVGGAGGTTTGGTAGGGNAGAGGAGTTAVSSIGNTGAIYGGGGSGGTKTSNGGAGAGGYMTITYTGSNDVCSGGITLASNITCVTTNGSTAGATDNNEVGDCVTGTENSVWYQFQAVATTHTITVTGITGFDPVLNIISACGSATAPSGATCVNNTNDAGTETLTLTGLTVGNYYKIQVHDFQGDSTANGFTICVTHPNICATPTTQPTTLTFNTLTTTSINGTFTAASPAPSGYLIVRSSSLTPPTLTNGVTYAVGVTTLTPGTTRVIQGSAVTSNAVSFSDSGLTSNTKYYYHIFSYNNSCSGEPYYLTTSPLTNSAITCPVAPTLPVNSAITSSGFTVSWTASAAGGSAAPIDYILEVYTDSGFTIPVSGSPFLVGTPVTYAVTGLSAGTTYYYRIKANNESCDSSYLTGSVLTACATPTAQPTTLTFNTLTTTSLNGAFTAASPAPSGYLIVRSSSLTPPTLTNGVTYAVGITTLTPGTTRVIQGSAVTSNAVSFSDSGLTSNTRYYYHIFSYNNSCSGEPHYLTTSPLTNNAVTCPVAPTLPVNSAITGSGFTVTWTASSAGGSAATINYTLEVFTDAGFTTPIAGSPFSVGTPVTYALTGLNASTTYYYRIKANNASCDSSYLTGNATTILSNDICSQAIALTVNPSLACTTSTTGSTIGATDNNETGDCTTGTENSVWYQFQAVSSTHIVTVTGVTGFDPVLNLISACGSATAPSGASCVNNTNDAGTETLTLTGLTVGSYYKIQVHDFQGDSTANGFTICVTTPAPPVNNQCANATSLACSTSNLAGSTANALSYTHGTGCLMSSYGAWYTFTGDGNSSTISVTTTTNDIELSISSGSCGSLTNIACQDVALSSGTETYTFTTAVGVNYYIYIANWYSAGTSTDTGSFTISRTCVVPYNPCSSIPNIAACGSSTSVTIASGTGGYGTSSCGWVTSGVEQIYTFTPASTGNFSITQASSFFYIDYMFKPVSSGCSSTGWTCIDDMLGAATSPTFTLTAGTQYYILLDPETTTGGNVNFTINCPAAALTNDEPCSAISLTVNTTCSYSTYTNSGAAASGGITAPGCANYIGGDVWFSAVVPATGVLTVDLLAGVITDSGMAFYSGTCGSLTLLECDDDDSTNGLMSNISMTGLTPGQTIFIRVWEYGNDNNGTFGICATTPSCPPPSDLYANILSTTSTTVNWANTSPPSSNGYQYYITTTNTQPTSGSTPTGSTAAGVNGVTLTGLTSGQVYYFWVRAYCGGTDYSSWFGPTNYTPCAVGSGSGTTTLSCPSVLAGGLGLNGGDPAAIACSASSTCTNLEATYLQLNQATDYTVASIPYAPPYQYSCLQNPVSVNVDDKWSPIINLPFNFCFYGNNYNKCLIGSNGVITFDTTGNTPGGYSAWSFNADLPNTSLFKNTIFGVYHDIDPGIGGKVSWELITLNTGCRALVASWHDIPMFSSTCNSSLYTGMIVLYENTNVIDVFIKEKNICATWNNGNAIVGVQNSTGTAAVVAANRNGLSTNWAVTDEAWRFTPSGPSLTSIKWYEGNGTTGTVVGTTDIVTVCPSSTTVYTAEVTYALCSGTNLKYTDNVLVTITGTKIWDGSTNVNWNIDDNWTPSGVPTSTDCVVIPDVANDPVISGAPNAVGYNLLLYSNALLTINSNQNLTITDKVTVQTGGVFTINNSASLIQINNVLNSGNITYKRESPNIRTLDYVYWSSPVANFNVSNIVSPYSFGAIYTWNTTIPNSNAGWGTWQNFSGTMVIGKGYIARSPGTAPFNNTTFNVLSGSFTGVPNNGNITVPIERGPDQNTLTHYGTNGTQITNLSDNWNLLGNPYPSAIRASQFLFDNNTKIEGNVRLWTHGQLPTNVVASPFYGSFISNYSPGDYLTYNFTGTSCCPAAGSDLFIGAGQGFFVQMIDGPPVAAIDNNTVAFTNSLRSATYSNSTFYKIQNSTTSASSDITNIERNRIWLDLVNPNNQTDRTLFGYIENATMGRDSFYDCVTQNTGGTLIYSLVDDTKFSIQGRALPFDINDEVPIGINIPTQGNYKIAIAGVDGFFSTQNIYLEDILLNITHDIRVSPYEFTASNGMINDRFKVIYINNALGNPDHSFDNTIKVMVNNEVAVSSSNLQMESIVVYNVLGQILSTYNNINSNYFTLSNLRKNNTTLLLRIKLQTGETVTRKVIY